jgi:catechol 2,3-dioxygenase-like lactoylglutathione lyase family enzyme
VRLWIAEGTPRSSVHLAFQGPDRAAVSRFYEAALHARGKDNGKPGPRPDYSETYYAAFVLDPDGNNIEAVTYVAASKRAGP